MGLLDEVRASASAIARSARFVSINHEGVHGYAKSLPISAALTPTLDPATHYLGEPDDTLAYVVTLDAINFGSGYFPHLRKRAGMSGSFTVAAGLKDAWPLSLKDLASLTVTECAHVFGQSLEDPAVAELMGLFATALQQLAGFVSARGGFQTLVASAEGSAERLASLLAEMPFYRDVGFYKRAQLTAADLQTAQVAQFEDLERLTIFADNLVPHVLRVDGVLRYDPDLLGRINREQLIPAGSPEEREIRACALHAVELISDALDRAVMSMQLDYLLWNRGQAPDYKAQPRHRTRTVYY